MDASNAKVQYESGQDLVAFVALTDQGDHKDFRSADALWSNRAGYEPDVKPNGLATGGVVSIATSGSSDVVDVAALTCYLAGVLTSVNASADLSIARPTASHVKYSITVTSAGAISAVKGEESTSLSTTRGAAGGPPLILPTSIELAQIWLSAAASAAIAATEIKQVVGTHCERYDYPTWEESRFNISGGVIGNAGIVFSSALPLIHSLVSPEVPVPKAVYAQYYEPAFTDVPKSSDFVPPETTHSVSSKQIYGTTLGASSSSLNQGSFTAFMQDGISDGILGLKNLVLFFKFFQNRLNSTPYILTQGKLGIARTFPAGDQISAACTISAEAAAVEVTG
ncbi:MAG: hypothetical protein M0P74_00835 [Syntrophales bacterium]|jgi:hypothetical protein|nr:hypothetical protein [Syntrophales bacterium]